MKIMEYRLQKKKRKEKGYEREFVGEYEENRIIFELMEINFCATRSPRNVSSHRCETKPVRIRG